MNIHAIKRDVRLTLEYFLTGKVAQEVPRDIGSLQYWDTNAKTMREHYAQSSNAAKYSLIADRIRKHTPKTILEVGTGFGFSLKCLATQYQANWYGCDFSAPLIDEARSYCGELATFFLWDMRTPPPEMRFDLVFTHGSFTCLKTGEVSSALRNISTLAPTLILAEHDFSGMSFLESLRFKKERGYAVHDYRRIFSENSALLCADSTPLGLACGYDPFHILYEIHVKQSDDRRLKSSRTSSYQSSAQI